jgi:tRNA threonylcarbamoyladenosine modification (KEOPS) complex Cgi121 subunit
MPIVFLEKYGKYVMITGVRNAKIQNSEQIIEQLRHVDGLVESQILDAKNVAGVDHLLFAALNALKAQTEGKQLTTRLAVEILLYASGQRQIKNAIASLGVSPLSKKVAVIGIAGKQDSLEKFKAKLADILHGELDESILEEGEEANIRRLFNITEVQMKTVIGRNATKRMGLTKLVIEKMALLSSKA